MRMRTTKEIEPMSTYGSYVKLTAHSGQQAQLLELLVEAADAMTDVKGCDMYIVNTSPNDPDSVWVTEIWRSREEHDASLTGETAKAQIQRALLLLAGPPEAIILQPIGGKGLKQES